ncbi:ABC transporter ATP-binding protein [Novispirillum sp. DQ9]|uniref:ABC transporter ATP-binding protein n=1 Tax=Novispirillum sp. DQ9 TaxID=3398612 RepID=UPI003C7DE1B0
MIDLTDIRKSYRVGPVDVEILKGVSFSIAAGETVSIMGSSGSGKSTLMNIMGLLDKPTSGAFRLDGRDTAGLSADEQSALRNRHIGFVFQAFHLLPRLSALDNVALPLAYRGVGTRERREAAGEWLERVGMADRAHHRPNELSGGQRQRVAIARALVGTPSLVLADEPTGALDTRVGQEVMDLFLGLGRDSSTTIVIITHDPGIAAQCGRQLLLRDGQLVTDDGVFARARPAHGGAA